jgi:hypothetical protein
MVSEHQILYIYIAIETLRQDFSIKFILLIIIYPKNTLQDRQNVLPVYKFSPQ